MTLWLILTAMALATAVLVMAPFIGNMDERHMMFSGEIEVFRDQLKEVERESAAGLIDADEADTARSEIKRRVLDADRANKTPVVPLSHSERMCVAVAAASIVLLGSFGLYALKGRPDLPSSPASSRPARSSILHGAAGQVATLRHLQAGEACVQCRAPAELGTIQEAVKRLIERNDWRVLGWFITERFSEVAIAVAPQAVAVLL